MDKLSANNKIDTIRIIIFLIIAFGVSNIFRFNIFHLNEILEENSEWSYLVTQGILEGSGIFLAGILGLYLLKKQRSIDISQSHCIKTMTINDKRSTS